MKKNVRSEPIDAGHVHRQLQGAGHLARRRHRARCIAESDFFEPMTFGSLITPGFGGRVYFSTGKGFIVMQVRPKAAAPSNE